MTICWSPTPLDDKEIHSVAPAKVLTGEVDTYEERDSITVDGTKYKYNDIVGSDSKNPDYGKDETFSVGDSCTLVLDEHGFIMYVDEATPPATMCISRTPPIPAARARNAKAAAYFTDGTYKGDRHQEDHQERHRYQRHQLQGRRYQRFQHRQRIPMPCAAGTPTLSTAPVSTP